jgi:hypothetical protein
VFHQRDIGAVTQDTLESVCADLVGTPDPETIRRYLNEQLTPEGLPELQQQLNEALAQEIPKRVWRQERDIAIDLHDRPYYGSAPQEEAGNPHSSLVLGPRLCQYRGDDLF